MNLIDKVPPDMNRVANDLHYYLIEMWKALQNGWIPPKEISKCEYLKVKNNQSNYEPHLVGYIGFNASYNGVYMSGYAGKIITKEGKQRDYTAEAYRNINKQSPNLQNVTFI